MGAATFGYLFTALLLLCSAALHLWKGNLRLFDPSSRPFAVNNADFTKFRCVYAVGHLGALFADSLQAPFLYMLFQSYAYVEADIALLYVVGLATNMVASVFVYHCVQHWERRLVCFVHCALTCTSCMLKACSPIAWSVVPLVCSRLLDGVATTLLLAPFQDWYLHEHLHRFDFPKEWIPISFRFVSLRATVLAIVAGYASEVSNYLGSIAFPFLLCIPTLLLSSMWIYFKWSPNQADSAGVAGVPLRQELLKARRVIFRRPNVVILSVVQALYESTLSVFVFIWTPLIIQMKGRVDEMLGYGSIYACLMAGSLLGVVAYCKLTIHLAVSNLLAISAALSFCGMGLATMVAYPGSETTTTSNLLLVAFSVFEIGAGLYFPVMQRLQKDVLPADSRAFVVSIFRIPLNLIAMSALLFLRHNGFYGNWLLLSFCTVSSLTCLLISLLLARMIRRSDVDYFMLQLKDDDQMEA